MRISDEDRSLAAELAEILGLTDRDAGMLRVTLWAHRQLPADEKPTAAAAQVAPGPCGNIFSYGPGVADLYCALRAGHAGQHESADGASAWGTLTKDSPGQVCGAQMPVARESATCGKPAGHPGVHVVGVGDLAGSRWPNDSP